MEDLHQNMFNLTLSSIERDLFFYLGALEQLHAWWINVAISQMNRFSMKPSFLDIINTLETAAHSMMKLCEAQQNTWTKVSTRKRKSDTMYSDFSGKCCKNEIN